ncbi:hypothetical protein O6H91_08G056700 [Diphasiastrum complanatum]|uniref:Uncharacterized protein n=1 Tax=Diphasiastrum complanatum TaxID=34168 RepID=A0ACC2CYA0_DIPCM|nr:hypothetical protein O6H91_Y557600 [Diphasiastrum complanatum]KAJ7546845.1 hypothetical protein O6H91_08G056700 [Diphasiastrum complanatum]
MVRGALPLLRALLDAAENICQERNMWDDGRGTPELDMLGKKARGQQEIRGQLVDDDVHYSKALPLSSQEEIPKRSSVVILVREQDWVAKRTGGPVSSRQHSEHVEHNDAADLKVFKETKLGFIAASTFKAWWLSTTK